MFCSELFKDFATKVINHIKETEHVKENTGQHILPALLNKFDEHRIAIKAVHSTLSDHHKNTSIKCIEKTVKNIGDKIRKSEALYIIC